MFKGSEKIFKYLIYTLLVLSVFSTCSIIIINTSKLPFNFGVEGFTNLLSFFDFPIKTTGAAITLYVVQITLIRMRQSEAQLFIMNKQLKLNEKENLLNENNLTQKEQERQNVRIEEILNDVHKELHGKKISKNELSNFIQYWLKEDNKWLLGKISENVMERLKKIDLLYADYESKAKESANDDQKRELQIKFTKKLDKLFTEIQLQTITLNSRTFGKYNLCISGIVKPIFKFLELESKFTSQFPTLAKKN